MAGLGCSRCNYTGSYVAFEGMGDLEQEFDCPNCSPDPDLDDLLDDSGDAFEDELDWEDDLFEETADAY